MRWLPMLLGGLIVGTVVPTTWSFERQFSTAVNKSAKTLGEAFPSSVNHANARLDDSVLSGPRRIPTERAKRLAVADSLRWIEKVINPLWRPKDGLSVDSLIMIRGKDGEPDIVRMLWNIRGYQIEVSQIAKNLVVRLTPPSGADMGKTLGEKTSFVKEMCAQLLADRDARYDGQGGQIPVEDIASKICDYSFTPENIKVFDDGIIGVPVMQEQLGVTCPSSGEAVSEEDRSDQPLWEQTRASWSYWWRNVCWWHDGATIGFYFPKKEADAIMIDYGTTGPLRWLESEIANRPTQ